MNIDDLLAAAALQLAKAGIEEASLDARLLFQHLTAMTRSRLVLQGKQSVDDSTLQQYQRLIIQRSQRIPLQHLTGSQEFWSRDFVVSPAVLIPRPETEFLLEQVLAVCSSSRNISCALDMCTGSGVIAVVLAKELRCRVTAVDISEAALVVAAENIRRHQAIDLITLVCSDLFAALNRNRKFDVIVSNPPYIADAQIGHLEPEVSRAEPRLALSGGPTGLRLIEQIAIGAEGFLQPGGWIFLEIGADQKNSVTALFKDSGRQYDEVRVIDDWSGRPRVLQARYAPKS
jgi:release factor glutamine methyltransferase